MIDEEEGDQAPAEDIVAAAPSTTDESPESPSGEDGVEVAARGVEAVTEPAAVPDVKDAVDEDVVVPVELDEAPASGECCSMNGVSSGEIEHYTVRFLVLLFSHPKSDSCDFVTLLTITSKRGERTQDHKNYYEIGNTCITDSTTVGNYFCQSVRL